MEPAIKYRLIKTEKHTGARLGEIITPPRDVSNSNVHAGRNSSHRQNISARRTG